MLCCLLQALRAKRTVEQQYEEAHSRINELTTINVNIASSRAKLEQELSQLAGDYEEVTKELRVSDERYQRVQNELKHTVEILHEEQERIVKIETIKKSLEIEVKNLSVRLEEVEANAIVGGKRIISKLEARVSFDGRASARLRAYTHADRCRSATWSWSSTRRSADTPRP